ncbi:MAG: ATP-binding protein, partial [Candidatus Scalindua sp.]
MSDERLDSLKVSETKEEYGAPIRIDRIKLVNYKFFHGEFELPVGGENLLIYGENGSGKSSIY